jgi:uncharacterized protein (DUF433 family)
LVSILEPQIMTLQELQRQVLQLSLSDRWQLVQALLASIQQDNDTWPGIEKTPGICGGDARVANTRIPVWILVQARNLGNSEADLLQNYPTLRAGDLANAWDYAAAHTQEIDQAIRENDEA